MCSGIRAKKTSMTIIWPVKTLLFCNFVLQLSFELNECLKGEWDLVEYCRGYKQLC